MFAEKSIVVKTWFTAVMSEVYQYSDVSKLSNLREQVILKLNEIGYVTENEDLV